MQILIENYVDMKRKMEQAMPLLFDETQRDSQTA